jgi:hypothetical protein
LDRCSAIKPDGERCGGRAISGSEWCWNHDPAYAAARRRNASKGGHRGGRGRPQVEVADIKAQLQDLVEAVLAGEQETSRASVANQLLNTRLRAVELERKVRETEELGARVEELERRAELRSNQRKGRAW